MPPFPGQGMGSGLYDVLNLAWKLDLVLFGNADETLLDSYVEKRKTHVRAIIDQAVELGKVVCTSDPVAAAARDAALLSGEVPPPPPFPTLIGRIFHHGERNALGQRTRLQAEPAPSSSRMPRRTRPAPPARWRHAHDPASVVHDAEGGLFQRHVQPGKATHGCSSSMVWPRHTDHAPSSQREQPPGSPGTDPDHPIHWESLPCKIVGFGMVGAKPALLGGQPSRLFQA